MSKLVVFLSHIHEEADIAASVKKLIGEAFLGLADVFVSSDPSSIAYGQKWLESITTNLHTCSVELVLCSPESIKRPWINFEAGAGWVRDIPVIPLCHSGLDRSALPIPMNLLQAANANDPQDLRGALATIANALGSSVPRIDVTDFVESVNAFGERYMFWNKFDRALQFTREFFEASPDAQVSLKSGQDFSVNLTETAIAGLRNGAQFLLANDLMRVEQVGGVTMTPTGDFYGMGIRFTQTFRDRLRSRPK
jgi:hypothetical protein